MTFLHDDLVLYKFLSDAGLLEQLSKSAQDMKGQAHQIALKMAQNLLVSNTNVSGQDADIFTRHLVDLTAFLNYLYANKKRASDGNLIVVQSNEEKQNKPPEEQGSYIWYDSFWVHMQGLHEQFTNLQQAAEQKGNEALRPFVKHLLDEAKSKMKTDFTMQKDPRLVRDDPYATNTQNQKHPYQVNMAIDESTAEEAARDNSTQAPTQAQQSKILANAIQRIPFPFPDQNVLEPYIIQKFINYIDDLFTNNKQLQADGEIDDNILMTLRDTNESMDQIITKYESVINTYSEKNPTIRAHKRMIPYIMGSQEHNDFINLFGGQIQANDIYNLLLSMVRLARLILINMTKSPKLMDRQKDLIMNQKALSDRIISNLVNR